MTRELTVTHDVWPLKKPFIIARSTRQETHTITVELREHDAIGFGEGVASPRYGETNDSVIAQINSARSAIEEGANRQLLREIMPAGAARNAVDTAMWDLEAKLSGQDVGMQSGLGWPNSITTVQTVSILPPEEMHMEAKRLKNFPIIKVKLNSELVRERIHSVHAGAPQSLLLIDANESWSINTLLDVAADLEKMNVVMIEQPLHAEHDSELLEYHGPIPIYADESCHTKADLPNLANKYQGVNIKLDKTGGLTEALDLMHAAKLHGFDVMVGCMLSTSLGIAPAMFPAIRAKYVDIDAPALLAKDRQHRLTIDNGLVTRLSKALWGGKIPTG